MANNYYQATGVLVFSGNAKVTPVIRALFAAFGLDSAYPGGNEVYIARSDQLDSTWRAIFDGIREQAAEIGIVPPSDEFENRALLEVLGRKFNCDNEEYRHLVDLVCAAEDDDAEIRTLFNLAMVLRDGHNLKSIKIEGCWHCSKAALFEFGGHGQYVGKNVALDGSSGDSIAMGEAIEVALEASDFRSAANVLSAHLNRLLEGVTDASHRRAIWDAIQQRSF